LVIHFGIQLPFFIHRVDGFDLLRKIGIKRYAPGGSAMATSPVLLFIGKSWLLMIVLFSLGCRLQSLPGKEVSMTDMSLIYRWDTGSIPPPDYYEYEIIIGPAQEGEICFRPDYPAADTPTWKERFNVSKDDIRNLQQAIQQLSTDDNETPHHIGGSRETLRLQYAGHVPVEHKLTSEQGRKVAQMIKVLVPHDTWQRLLNTFESYREERR
jgi:hypothetical protein